MTLSFPNAAEATAKPMDAFDLSFTTECSKSDFTCSLKCSQVSFANGSWARATILRLSMRSAQEF